MCKHLRDILFPLNILGKKVHFITYDTPRRPPAGQNSWYMEIEFEGERMELTYLEYYGHIDTRIDTPIKKTYSGSATDSLLVVQSARGLVRHPYNYQVYLGCVNTTKLIINGEQII